MSVVCFAESISLAVLEVVVHLQATRILHSYSLIRIDFVASAVRTVDASTLQPTWADFPAPPELQALGDTWVASSESALLKVPSSIVPLEHILLLSSEHPDRTQLAVPEPLLFRLDPRLLT